MTARLHLMCAMPALRTWAAAGLTSLREVSAADIRAVLPPSGNPRSTMGAGLQSVLTVLKQQKVIFANPIASIRTGYHEPRQPLPVDLALVREALESPDPARAAVVALVAFHGLRVGQVRALMLTDLRDGRLHLRDRTVLHAGPARVRLAAWLDYRARNWPGTANPHLFITMRPQETSVRAGQAESNLLPRLLRTLLKLGRPLSLQCSACDVERRDALFDAALSRAKQSPSTCRSGVAPGRERPTRHYPAHQADMDGQSDVYALDLVIVVQVHRDGDQPPAAVAGVGLRGQAEAKNQDHQTMEMPTRISGTCPCLCSRCG